MPDDHLPRSLKRWVALLLPAAWRVTLRPPVGVLKVEVLGRFGGGVLREREFLNPRATSRQGLWESSKVVGRGRIGRRYGRGGVCGGRWRELYRGVIINISLSLGVWSVEFWVITHLGVRWELGRSVLGREDWWG